MIETSLSFLGLGVQPPNASWGLMLNEAQTAFLQYPYLAVFPVWPSLWGAGFNLLGDGLTTSSSEGGLAAMAEDKLIDIQNLTIRPKSGRILVNNISLDMEKVNSWAS